MYYDVNVNGISKNHAAKKKDDPTTDMKHFFSDLFRLDEHGKKRQHCNICRWVFALFSFYDYLFSFVLGNARATCRVALVMIVHHFVGIYKPIIG